MSGKSLLRAAVLGGLALSGLAATSALACKGQTTLLRDDFTDEDPAWDLANSPGASVADGAMKVTSDPGHGQPILYAGQMFPAADVCVDMIAPPAQGKAVLSGGISFWNGRGLVDVMISSDGTASVAVNQNGVWAHPVPSRKADTVKTAPGAVNNLRVVWKGPPDDGGTQAPDPSVQIFINGKPFVKFKMTPNANRQIGFYVESEGGTYLFKNLNVTQ